MYNLKSKCFFVLFFAFNFVECFDEWVDLTQMHFVYVIAMHCL